MSEFNPYAPPQADQFAVPPVMAAPMAADGMWANGKVLVIRRDARFPNRCVKSNVPAVQRLHRKLAWHPPIIAITLLLGVLVYAILALVMTKRATIDVPLSDEWFARRRNSILTGWGIAFFGLLLFVSAFFLPEGMDTAMGICLMVGFLLPIVGWAYGGLRSRIVWPSKIDDQFIHLKGVNREMLAALPAWVGS